MSAEPDRVRELAERVARKLAGDAGDARPEGSGRTSLDEALADIRRRLAHIEAHISHEEGCGQAGDVKGAGRGGQAPHARPVWLSGTYVPATSHPSQERFTNIGEAVSELVEFLEGEKTCTVEPGDKPCDHCGACSSRGF